MRLLLVEDDLMLGEAVRDGLQQDGAAVDWVRTRAAAETARTTHDYAAMLLDLSLPDGDGLQMLRELRRRGDALPVVVITARDQITERVRGLDLGADDYLVKPFDLDELGARVRAAVRRGTGRGTGELHFGDVIIDVDHREVRRANHPVSLSARELSVLLRLAQRPGSIVSRAQLEEAVYGWGEEVESNAVEVHVHHLRRKLGERLIRTVRGSGYVIDPA